MSLRATNDAYQLAGIATATREQLSHPLVDGFARSALQAWRKTNALEDDDFWIGVSQALWRVRRDVAATPSPLAELGFAQLAEEIDRVVSQASAAYPDELVNLLLTAVGYLRSIAQCQDNPVGDALTDVLSTATSERSAVLVESSDRLSFAEAYLMESFPDVRVLVERELAAAGPFESVVVVGPSEWFKASLLLAPRAENFCFLTFGWMRDRPHEIDLFSDGHLARVERPIRNAPNSSTALVWEPTETSKVLRELPVDWQLIGRHNNELLSGLHQHDATSVVAHSIVLAGQQLTFIEVDSRVDVVLFHSDGGTTVVEKPVAQLAVDDFIVLRGDDSTADYREVAADRLLGDDAKRLRAIQAGWKDRLRKAVDELGWAETDRRLREKGLRVQSTNLSYRLAPHSFRTRDESDFAAFMDLIGLRDRAEVIWRAMGRLESAHRRAGHKTRQRLEDRLDESDLTAALRFGRIDVTIDEDDAGSLAILAVIAISPETTEVSSHRIRKLNPLEGSQWHG